MAADLLLAAGHHQRVFADEHRAVPCGGLRDHQQHAEQAAQQPDDGEGQLPEGDQRQPAEHPRRQGLRGRGTPRPTQTIKFEKAIHYEYSDYRSLHEVDFNNTLVNSTLTDQGLYLLFSQVIQDFEDFECGDPVPFEPNDPATYGGMQEFLSNSLLKSTLRHAIRKQALDVNLTTEFWQSRAFQFFVGDLHEVMPTATKHLPTLTEITGICRALDDPVFAFAMKSTKTYEAKVNFACSLQFNNTRFLAINLVASYEIAPRLSSKALDIQLTNLAGTPAFIETDPFRIEYQELAEFMVSETMALAKSGYVYGTGYKMKYPRKYPAVFVRQSYLFLYDASATPKTPARD